jgi:transposase
VLAARLTIQAPALPREQGRSIMTASYLADNTFIGIDVGGAGLDVAWHRGDSAHYANRPDAIATLVKRLQAQPEVTRIVVEPTGGYEKLLVKALRQAQLPVEIIHTTRFKAYRELVGVKAKSDSSDARRLAAYAAAPDEVRGRKSGHVELPEDAIRETLGELASRRDQLKHMIHAESCRLNTVRLTELRDAITAHLEALRTEDKQMHQMMLALVRQRVDLRRDKRLLSTIKAIGVKSALAFLASVPELGRIDNKAAAALIGVAPFVHKSGTVNAPSLPAGTIRFSGPSTNDSSPKANHPNWPSSPYSGASLSSPTPYSSQASHGKELSPLDTQHGRFRARVTRAPE